MLQITGAVLINKKGLMISNVRPGSGKTVSVHRSETRGGPLTDLEGPQVSADSIERTVM